ncbi:MAG TPA: cobalamin biosynthesis protein [Polyangiaceae bacterium]|nr:cobalamin biosynthesis protein [Polyangiaceae bacterium]
MIAAGLGCRSGCPTADIVAAIARAAAASGVSLAEVHALYSAEFKADELSLREAAEALAKPLVLLTEAALAARAEGALTRSAHALARHALPSVAETAALAGAFELGERSADVRLLGPRQVAGAAACALARVGARP